MEYIIKAAGKEWITTDKFLYETALTIEDTGKVELSNKRFRFVINHYFRQKVEDKPIRRKVDNTIASLHPLSIEMGKSHLSYEDEEYLDEILGPDPYIPLY